MAAKDKSVADRHLIADDIALFPKKLWKVVNSGSELITWSDDGKSINVNATDFENSVMAVHPGLVEISTFANFRRQMREYGFDWLQFSGTEDFQFSHQFFVRDNPKLLSYVLTRRRLRRFHNQIEEVKRTKVVKRLPSECNPKIGRGRKAKPEIHDNAPIRIKRPYRKRAFYVQNVHLPMLDCPGPRSGMLPTSQCGAIPVGFTFPSPGMFAPQQSTARWVQSVQLENRQQNRWTAPQIQRDVRLVPCKDGAARQPEVPRCISEEQQWWNNCFPWMLQQDPDAMRQFEIDTLRESMANLSQRVDIPIHFYPDGNGCGYSNQSEGAISPRVIEIVPIDDDDDSSFPSLFPNGL